MTLKLKKIGINEKVERLAVSVKKSTMDLLSAYQAAYKSSYGHDIEKSVLVENILNEYIRSDKEFLKMLETPRAAPEQKTSKSSDAPPDLQGSQDSQQ